MQTSVLREEETLRQRVGRSGDLSWRKREERGEEESEPSEQGQVKAAAAVACSHSFADLIHTSVSFDHFVLLGHSIIDAQ